MSSSIQRALSTLWGRISFSFQVHSTTNSSTPLRKRPNPPATIDGTAPDLSPPKLLKHSFESSPRKVPQVQRPERVDPKIPEGDTPSEHVDEIIRRPLDYLLAQPGKQVRTQLILSFNEWFKVPQEKLQVIIDVVELLHTASLLIDDIQDGSKLRRGHPSAHMVYGDAQTINSGNFAYFLAQEKLSQLDSLDAFKVFLTEILNLHRGQGLELYYRDSMLCPSEAEYMEIVTHKTGGLFRLAIGLLQSQSEVSVEWENLANTLGIIFQIRDDYQNLQSDQYTKSKGLGEDLTEGKFSFPIIHSIMAARDDTTLIDILRQRTEDEKLKLEAIKHIESTGSFEYCRQRLEVLQEEAIGMVAEMERTLGLAKGIRKILGLLALKP